MTIQNFRRDSFPRRLKLGSASGGQVQSRWLSRVRDVGFMMAGDCRGVFAYTVVISMLVSAHSYNPEHISPPQSTHTYTHTHNTATVHSQSSTPRTENSRGCLHPRGAEPRFRRITRQEGTVPAIKKKRKKTPHIEALNHAGQYI